MRARILAQRLVEDRVGDLVADFVGVAFADALRREHVVFSLIQDTTSHKDGLVSKKLRQARWEDPGFLALF
jgi:hypothetical protein